MEAVSMTLGPHWLKPMIGLIQKGEFGEADALAEFFPAIPERLLVQCACRIEMQDIGAADRLLRNPNLNLEFAGSFIAKLLSASKVNLLNSGKSALERQYTYVGQASLYAQLHLYPHSSPEVVDALTSNPSYDLNEVDPILKKTLEHYPDLRPKIISTYFRVSERASKKGEKGLATQFASTAINLSDDLNDFLSYAAGGDNSAKMLALLDHVLLLGQAPWYKQTEFDEAISTLARYLIEKMREIELNLRVESEWIRTQQDVRQEFQDLFARIERTSGKLSDRQRAELHKFRLALDLITETMEALNYLEKDHDELQHFKAELTSVATEFEKALERWRGQRDSIPLRSATSHLEVLISNLASKRLLERLHSKELERAAKRIGRAAVEIEASTEDEKWLLNIPALLWEAQSHLIEFLRSRSYEALTWNLELTSASGRLGYLDRKELKDTQLTRIERFTRVDFPSFCHVEKEIELKVQLTRSIPNGTRALRQVVITASKRAIQVVLDVIVTAISFTVQPAQKRLILPVHGDSKEIAFSLTPHEAGRQVVEIEFFYNSARVGYCLVPTYVGTSSSGEKAGIITLEDPLLGLVSLESAERRAVRRTLHVNWMEREGKLIYTVLSKDTSESGAWKLQDRDLKYEIERHLRDLNAFLTEVVSIGKPLEEDWESVLLNLKAVGKNLFDILIPKRIANIVRGWESGSTVIISTNEQWIPWELIYDGDAFWGAKFTLARNPRFVAQRDMPDENRPETTTPRSIKRVVNVVGGDLGNPDLKRRAMELFDGLLPPTAVEILLEKPVAVLAKAIKGADALQLTCHGLLEPHILQIDNNKSRATNLLPETIGELPLEPGCMVFANACASAVPVLTFGRFTTFGWEFYRRGANVFLGTLGAVPIKYAVDFAEAVYRELLRKDRSLTIGEAVAAAKKAVEKDRNLFWLLYCLYGDPDFTVQR